MTDEWYVARRGPDGNKRFGPVPLQQLRGMVDTGKVQGEDLVWNETMTEWQRADQCADLAPFRPRPDLKAYGPGRVPRGPAPRYDDRPPPPRRSSGWVVALVVGGIVGVVLLLGCGGVIAYMALHVPPTPYTPINGPLGGLGQEIPYGQSQLFYTNNVVPLDAQKIGDYLNSVGVFPPDRGVTVQVDRAPFGGAYTVRFCVLPGTAFNPAKENFYRGLRDDLRANVLPGSTIHVELCDENMITVETLP